MSYQEETRHLSPNQAPVSLWAWLAVWGIGCGLRLRYPFEPINYDEAVTFLRAEPESILTALSYYTPNNHLFHTFLLKLSIGLFGPFEWSIRLPAFLAGLALIPTVGYIFNRVFGPLEGLLGAALVASSGWLICYSVNARGYTLAVLLLLWAFYAAWRTVAGRGVAWGLAAGFLAGLAVGTIPSMLWPAAGIILAVGLAKGPWPQRIGRLAGLGGGVLAGGVLCYLPLMLAGGLGSVIHNPYVEPVPLAEAFHFLVFQLADVSGRILPLGGRKALAPESIASLLSLPAAGYLIWRRGGRREDWFLLLMLPWPFFLELLQHLKAPARTFLYLTPLVYLLWLRALPDSFRRIGSRRLAALGLALTALLAGLLLLTGEVADYRNDASPAAPHVAAFLVSQAGLGPFDRIIADVPDDAPLAYYLWRAGVDRGAVLRRGIIEGERIFVLESRFNTYPRLGRLWPGLESEARQKLASWDGVTLWRLEP